MSQSSAPKQEYVVRVPKRSDLKRYSVIKFNGNLKVDTLKWAQDGQVCLHREDNKQTVLASAITQDYGEGSEYGRAVREEARRKKYGRQRKTYQLDNQPWKLKYKEPEGRERKFRSIRDGGAGEHADYWVFLKSGDEFHAYKVDDWHQFLPAITHKTLDIDQAEEQFQQRSRVMNQFALKAQIQKTLNMDDGEELEKPKGLKIKDDFSDTDQETDDERGEEEGKKEKTKLKKKKKKRDADEEGKKDKRVRVKDGDEVARYESEDGEDEGREYDYMSDSGSDSDRDNVPMEDKIEKALVGVGEEAGLKKMMDSDEESEDDADDLNKKLLGRDAKDDKKNMDIEERDSSGSDSGDEEKVDSVLFLKKKAAADNKKRALETTSNDANEAKRAKLEEKASAPPAPAEPEGLNEQTVRKYLERKPQTTKELLAKVMAKCGNIEKAEILKRLAAILKKIGPHQFKQKVGKKEVLFFSLQNNVA